MDAQQYGRRRKGPIWYSPFLLTVALSPVFLQVTCEEEGDTTLSMLEFEVAGANQVAFSPSNRSYDVWSPGGPAILRAQSTDPGSELLYNYTDGNGFIDGGYLGIGSGAVTLDVPAGDSRLAIYVEAPGGASDDYVLNISDSLPQPQELAFEQIYVDLAYGGNGRPGWVRGGDIDGDGDLDIVAGGGRALYVYENDGFARGWLRHGDLDSTGGFGANGALLVDVDEDGDLDVISAKFYDDIGWWENPCGPQCDLSTLPQWSFHKIGEVGNNGSAGPHYYLHDIGRFPSSGSNNSIQIVAPAVSNSCGDVAMSWFEPGLDVRQEWSAYVIEPGRFTGSDGICNYAGLDTGDVNGDGRIDIAFSNGWYEAPVDARQTWPSSSWHPVTSYSEISNTLLRDLNGDGRLDFVTASGHYDGIREVHWYANPPGASGAWPVSVIASLRSPECLQVEDIDGDGDLDVVTCTLQWDQWDQEVHSVYVLENAGLGNATSWVATDVAPNSYPSHLLQLLDLNGDGSLDIISEATGYSVVSYYENLN